MRLTFVRHGQSPSNLQTLLDTEPPGPSLTGLGRQQARSVALSLAPPIDLLLASPLIRARETAEEIGDVHGVSPELRDGLREVQAGDLEMRNDADSLVTYRSAFLAWTRGDLDVRIPGGEDGHEAVSRVDEVVSEVLARGADSAVLVSHGAVIRTWVGIRAVNLTGFHDDPRLGNTGVVRLSGTSVDGFVLHEWDGQPAEALAPFQQPLGEDALVRRLSAHDDPRDARRPLGTRS